MWGFIINTKKLTQAEFVSEICVLVKMFCLISKEMAHATGNNQADRQTKGKKEIKKDFLKIIFGKKH